MPSNCNGLALIDEDKDFSKWNCRWSKKNVGRQQIEKKVFTKVSKRTKFKNPKPVCIVLEKEHVDFIKNQALQRSIQVGSIVETNELIREALQKAFPAPKQFDMFGEKKK